MLGIFFVNAGAMKLLALEAARNSGVACGEVC
jgi:hypothetical protein